MINLMMNFIRWTIHNGINLNDHTIAEVEQMMVKFVVSMEAAS